MTNLARVERCDDVQVSSLRVLRPNDYGGRFRSLIVEVDGHCVGGLRPNQEVELQLEPGSHQVIGRMDWVRSRVIEVNLVDDQSEASVRVSLPFRAILDIFVRPWRAIRAKSFSK